MKLENKIKTLACTFLLVGGVLTQATLQAQERKIKKADEEYKNLAYIDATKVYLDVAESGYKSEELFKKLGNSYYFNANYGEAQKWYQELFALTQNTEPEYYLRYSQTLKAMGDDAEAKKWYDTYLKKAGVDAATLSSANDYLSIINENSGRYSLQPANINTKGIEYATSLHDGNLMLTSSNRSKGSGTSGWDGLSFLDVFEASIKEDGSLGEIEKIDGDVNTKFHESSAIITKDGKTMYFTRSNTSPESKRSKKEIQHLKIYRAHLENGKWSHVEDLSINGDNYDAAHPALSPNEDKLYFASNMPGTLGATDLFVVSIDKEGSLGRPVNLGPKINTKGRESFPFLTKDNELYFSSDGHFGLGGYDVFYVKLKDNGYEGSILNVGKPINSQADDFGFLINDKKGYVSSNRSEGEGYDDLYAFTELKPIKELTESTITGTVLDKDTKAPLKEATVTLMDKDNKVLGTVKTDANGHYQFDIDPRLEYIVRAQKTDYDGDDVLSQKSPDPRQHNFELKRNVVEVKPKDNIANILNIIIHFDLDKYNIRPDAQVELEKLVSVMKQHPEIRVDVRSHTDSRANDRYNMVLSDKRAKATIDYLVSRGIDRSRLTGRGYGETLLLNGCSNGVKCSDAEHERNRRSEFIVVNP